MLLLVLSASLALKAHRTPLLSHKIFTGATVLTMDATLSVAEAVVTSGNRIVYVGDESTALSQRRWYSSVIDLHGKTLLPGLIDAHSHFLATGLSSVLVNLNATPVGKVDSLEQLYQVIKEAAADHPPGAWIVGFNYDNTRFPSASHPDRKALDEAAGGHPVYVRHHSGHMGVANSEALVQLLEFKDTSNASRNHSFRVNDLNSDSYSKQQLAELGRYPDGIELNGLLLEKMAPPLFRFLNDLSPVEYWRVFRRARQTYAQFGYTTVQEGSAGSIEAAVLSWLSTLGILPMRVNVWLSSDKLAKGESQQNLKPVKRKFFQSDTVKIIADGSPQGFTAHLSEPYFNDARSYGISLYSQVELARLIDRYQRAGFRVAAHANGDAAIENVINSVAMLQRPRSVADPEVILVHAQTIRPDQLSRLNALGISPSFFSSHSWYWGDWHRQQSLGEQRAAKISPTGSAARAGIDFTIHTDAPVTSPDPWQLLWITSERQTRSGFILGANERITREQAMQAMTLSAARQAGVENRLGSIEVGKLADLIIVSDNPLLVDDVRGIYVEETIVNGVSIFRR